MRVTPTFAGDHFVDSADHNKVTASLYYVETGITDTSIGVDEDKNGKVEGNEIDDGIDQTKLFLERALR